MHSSGLRHPLGASVCVGRRSLVAGVPVVLKYAVVLKQDGYVSMEI